MSGVRMPEEKQRKSEDKMRAKSVYDIYDPNKVLPRPEPKPERKSTKISIKPEDAKLKIVAANLKSEGKLTAEPKLAATLKAAQQANQKGELPKSDPITLDTQQPPKTDAEASTQESHGMLIPAGLESLVEPKKFLFQIERNPSSFGPSVYKSYDLFTKHGKRIFTIVNRSSKEDEDEFIEFRMVGPDGEVVVTFQQPVPTWGDEDFFSCCPRRHESDGIRVLVKQTEVGFITVQECAYKPCVFSGWRARPRCSRYHVRYVIQYVDGDGDVKTAWTHAHGNYGLEIVASDGQILGEISIPPKSNRQLSHHDSSSDFILGLENVSIHPNGKAVLLGLAIRHQLNVLFAHKFSPAMFNYMAPAGKPKRVTPTSI